MNVLKYKKAMSCLNIALVGKCWPCMDLGSFIKNYKEYSSNIDTQKYNIFHRFPASCIRSRTKTRREYDRCPAATDRQSASSSQSSCHQWPRVRVGVSKPICPHG